MPPHNVVYFLMLPFLVHKIFTFYINGVLNCKCPAPGPKGQFRWSSSLLPPDTWPFATTPNVTTVHMCAVRHCSLQIDLICRCAQIHRTAWSEKNNGRSWEQLATQAPAGCFHDNSHSRTELLWKYGQDCRSFALKWLKNVSILEHKVK